MAKILWLINILLLLFCFIAVSDCDRSNELQNIEYLKDASSGLCFAIYCGNNIGRVDGISEVPCKAIKEYLEAHSKVKAKDNQ